MALNTIYMLMTQIPPPTWPCLPNSRLPAIAHSNVSQVFHTSRIQCQDHPHCYYCPSNLSWSPELDYPCLVGTFAYIQDILNITTKVILSFYLSFLTLRQHTSHLKSHSGLHFRRKANIHILPQKSNAWSVLLDPIFYFSLTHLAFVTTAISVFLGLMSRQVFPDLRAFMVIALSA